MKYGIEIFVLYMTRKKGNYLNEKNGQKTHFTEILQKKIFKVVKY